LRKGGGAAKIGDGAKDVKVNERGRRVGFQSYEKQRQPQRYVKRVKEIKAT
jgi:hypothetical protein